MGKEFEFDWILMNKINSANTIMDEDDFSDGKRETHTARKN